MSSDTVHLGIPAESAYAAVARATAASVAVRAGATVDDVEDVRVAVSEAFNLLLAAGPAGEQQVHLDLTVNERGIAFVVSAPTLRIEPVDRDSFAWTILDALVEDADHQLTGHAEPEARALITGTCRLHVPA
jgi:serine/threonine-protein kinase RsbW